MADSAHTLVVGTRGSQLARTQSQWVIDRIVEAHPGVSVRMEIIRTSGDALQSRPLPEIGGKGLFTAELEQALLDGSIDLAVHSIKDLPTELGTGLAVLACPVREDPRDAWVSADGTALMDLPAGSIVGTSSLRRQAQLLMHRPDLRFVGLRGNVDTRIRKIREGQASGAVLAMAGLNRVGLSENVTHVLEPSFCLPAPGQGALALEGRANDDRVRGLLADLHDPPTALAVECERGILAALDAGCRAPVAVFAVCEPGVLRCEALVVNPSGTRHLRSSSDEKGNVSYFQEKGCASLVRRIIADLKARGADDIIAESRQA